MPRARPQPQWRFSAAPEASAAAALADALHLPPVVSHLLAARGHTDPESARRFLRPRLETLSPPSALADCERAAERIAQAIRIDEVIMVHGDYDVDGMSSTALLVRVLRALGATSVVPFVPHRISDGYDLSAAGVSAARSARASLVITCDCGTSAHAPVAELMAGGVDVIVTDHHLPGHGLPPAFAVVNPQRHDCTSPDKDLAGVGVAYKLALALCEAMGASPTVAHCQLDLVALATIADVAPLRGENRVLVRYGLRLLNETTHHGLRSLIRSSGLEGKPLTAGRVGFVLAPRLNAAGRIGEASLGLSLLLATDTPTANRIARDLEELNRNRQELDKRVLDEAMRQVDALDLDRTWGLVLHAEGWHAGVIGIVASRVVELVARPAVLVAVDNGIGKGSGRSIPAFDLHAALGQCAQHFERFGGHRAAAGLTMSAEHIPAFADAFNEAAHACLSRDDLVPQLRVDLEVPPDTIGDELEAMLKHFEPFGIGNPAPTFLLSGARLAGNPRRIGTDGLKMQLDLPRRAIDAIGWGQASALSWLNTGTPVDVAFRLERDEYRGESQLQLRVSAVRASEGATPVARVAPAALAEAQSPPAAQLAD